MEFKVRKGTENDVGDVLRLIKELAEYEHAADQVLITEEELLRDGFGEKKYYELLIAEHQGECVGMALYYPRYSTWRGLGLYLEDLVVRETYRRQGIGKMILDQLIQEAKNQKIKRIYWQVLDWNEPAIKFYEKYNAIFEDEWVNVKIDVPIGK